MSEEATRTGSGATRVGRRFATTQWSLVLAARDGTDSEARLALEALCEAYWYPLYAHVRRRGHSADEAPDLTQAFFADLLGRDFLGRVDQSRGRFRSFLLASLEHFLSRERDKAYTLKKGGGRVALSLDTREAEDRYQHEPEDQLTPDRAFERRWGLTVLERTMERLRAEASGQSERFDRFRLFLTGSGGAHYREVASDLGMTETAVKAAVHRLRQRYGQLLRQEIADTVADPAEVDDEVRYLLGVLQPWR